MPGTSVMIAILWQGLQDTSNDAPTESLRLIGSLTVSCSPQRGHGTWANDSPIDSRILVASSRVKVTGVSRNFGMQAKMHLGIRTARCEVIPSAAPPSDEFPML